MNFPNRKTMGHLSSKYKMFLLGDLTLFIGINCNPSLYPDFRSFLQIKGVKEPDLISKGNIKFCRRQKRCIFSVFKVLSDSS